MKRVAVVLLMSLALASPARAHAIHTTHTTVTADAQGYTLTVRAFADDLSASVARFSGRTPPADSSVRVPELVAYATARLTPTTAAGKPLIMQSCGVKRMQDAYVLCFRLVTATRTAPLRLGNQMLSELHADQVNIVQCDVAGSRRTNLFTRGRAATAIVERGVCAAS
ncbi:DUF6702 family protein [Gemmatimonas groenlandica]|uniref:Uncharacterized protein n=1 Tax=Gemmatimonas groenlandica TaxID=2732249 RepID=A0A6M4IXZ7_9BACT|nr:DUF6702 family protein [Gemmatimonas groenlandica]QJR37101.1 hypothetical protein HKW67_17035 [Gemmatimonas groenlandica]